MDLLHQTHSVHDTTKKKVDEGLEIRPPTLEKAEWVNESLEPSTKQPERTDNNYHQSHFIEHIHSSA